MDDTQVYNPRIYMEKAIEVMKKSVHEARPDDNKMCPFVGAILLKPDGTIDTAYRGEIRDGDHAEYTIIERKNRSNPLDGSILFVTLEPCAPDSRTPPKLSCAQRIVLARIKEVWIGIEDPDPLVDRKGIKFLENNGVNVQLFDRELQEQIIEINKDFLEQAEIRAVEDEEEQLIHIQLSSLEEIAKDSDYNDLSLDALEKYREETKILDDVNSDYFKRKLTHQGFLQVTKEGNYIPTYFGLLSFGKEPRTHVPEAGLLVTIQYPNGKDEVKDFNSPLVLIPDEVSNWLKDKLPYTINRDLMKRGEELSFPEVLLREGLVNALVHRDYDIKGAKNRLIVNDKTITIISPGGPVSPITLSQIQLFNAPILSRNPTLHYLFAQMKMAEERGLGLSTFKGTMKEFNLPTPQYSFENPYLVLTFYRTTESATYGLSEDLLKSLNPDELKGWQYIVTLEIITKREYAKQMSYDERKAERHLKKFMDLGLVNRIGSGKNIKYKVIKP